MSFKMLAKNVRTLVYNLDFEGKNMNYKVRQKIKMKHLEMKINLQNVSKQNMM